MCMDDFERKINPAIEALVTCNKNPDEGWYPKGNRRVRRWIVWLILGAISIIVVVSTMAARTTIIDERVTQVNSTTIQTAAVVDEIRARMETQMLK